MAKTASEVTKKSEEKHKVRSTSFKFKPEEMELLDSLSEKYGGRKAAVMAALEALAEKGNNKPSKKELLSLLDDLIPDD